MAVNTADTRAGCTPLLEARGCDVLTATGRVARLRPVAPTDAHDLLELHARASDRSLYLRFFTTNRGAPRDYVDRLLGSSAEQEALVVELGGALAAVGNYVRTGVDEAEVAFFVDDAHHGEGLATLLLEHLAACARRRGVRRFVAEVLADNGAMLRVLTDSGFSVSRSLDHDVVTVRLSIDRVEPALAAVNLREQLAEVRSLTPLLAPRAVAVIGAGRRPGTVGHEVLRSLLDGDFRGRVFAVNPAAADVVGLRAYPTVAAVPEPLDLAVIAVPAAAVETVVGECADRGVRAAVILSAGFGERGPQGRAAEQRLLRRARDAGMRLVGPNCLGLVNTDPQVRLHAAFAPAGRLAGSLALASQSGAVGIALLDAAERVGLGTAAFVSLGNRVDVSSNDLLLYWAGDRRVRVIALYLESFGNPRKFSRVARYVGASTPVLAVKAVRTDSGRRAGLSHTAAAASSDATVDALFAQAGVVRLDTLEELVDAARLLAAAPLPAGGRLGIVGNAGGAGILAADAAAAAGLDVPRLSAGLRDRLAELAGSPASTENPVDLGAAASPEAFASALTAIVASGEVDAAVVVFAATLANDADAVLAALGASSAEAGDVTLAGCILGLSGAPSTLPGPDRGTVPVYDFPESAVRALGAAVRYARWRSSPRGSVPDLPDVDVAAARHQVAELLGRLPEGGWIEMGQAASLLRSYGVPVVSTLSAETAEQAVRAAEQLGLPVALKAADASLVHKTEHGAVRLGLQTTEDVRAAYAATAQALGAERAHVLVQPMVGAAIEAVVGVVTDPTFGPVVMLGLGGITTDLLGDRVFRLAPLTEVEAAAMARGLRVSPLLFGYRGTPGVDVPALEDLLVRIGRLAQDLPEIAELDLNPLMLTGDGLMAVDVKLRLAPAADLLDPVLRSLR